MFFLLFWHQRIYDTSLGSRDMAIRNFGGGGIAYSSSWMVNAGLRIAYYRIAYCRIAYSYIRVVGWWMQDCRFQCKPFISAILCIPFAGLALRKGSWIYHHTAVCNGEPGRKMEIRSTVSSSKLVQTLQLGARWPNVNRLCILIRIWSSPHRE